MKKMLMLAVLVTLLTSALVATPALAAPTLQMAPALHPGIGLQFPLAALVSLRLGNHLALEASMPFAFSGLVSFEASLDAKLYLGTVTVAQLSLRPFIGAGATLIAVVGRWVPGARLLAGLEYRTPQLPVDIFAQITGSLISSGSPAVISVAGSLGGRYDF